MEHHERIRRIFVISIELVLVLFPYAEGGAGPVVLRLEGNATINRRNEASPVSLREGEPIEPGGRIETKINSRMIIDYGENCHIRLDERTLLEVEGHFPDEKSKINNPSLRTISGEIWIHIPKGASSNRGFSILTENAVIQSHQAIFRCSVLPSDSVLVKVYQGTATAKRKKNTARNKTASRKLKSWNHILKPMQQIYIRSDGTSTNPFQFMVKPDRNAWVLWNQSLDKKLGSSLQQP